MAQVYRTDIIVSDVSRLVHRLNQVEDGLTKAMRAEWKEAVEPARAKLSAALKSAGIPMRGFRKRGSPVSKTWNNRGQSSRVFVQMRRADRVIAQMRNQTILRMVIRSAATVIADMAGRGGKYTTPKGTKTDWYVYTNTRFANIYGPNTKPGFRRHTVTSQGDQMLSNLNTNWGGGPSRQVYPSVEKSMPAVQEKIGQIVGKYVDKTNEELGA